MFVSRFVSFSVFLFVSFVFVSFLYRFVRFCFCFSFRFVLFSVFFFVSFLFSFRSFLFRVVRFYFRLVFVSKTKRIEDEEDVALCQGIIKFKGKI